MVDSAIEKLCRSGPVKQLYLLPALGHNVVKRHLFFDHLTEERGAGKPVEKDVPFIERYSLRIKTLKHKKKSCGCFERAECFSLCNCKLHSLTAFSYEFA